MGLIDLLYYGSNSSSALGGAMSQPFDDGMH